MPPDIWWGYSSKRRSGASSEGGDEGRDMQEALIELNEAIEEQETKADYHRERLAEVRREGA